MHINCMAADGDRIYASNNEYGIPSLWLSRNLVGISI